MTEDTTRPSGRRHTSRRRRRAASRLRRAGFAAGGLGVLVAAGLLLGSLTGGGLPGASLVFSGDDSPAPGGSSSTTSSAGAGAMGSGVGAGRSDGGSSSTNGDGGVNGAGGAGTKGGGVLSPSTPGDPSNPAQPSPPTGPGTPTSPTTPTTPGDPVAPRTVPDADKLAAAALTAADLGGGWKQVTGSIKGIGFACDAGRTVTGDTSATRGLRRPGVTVTSHTFGYTGNGAAETFAAYRAAAAGCNGWKISEYARSLDISVTVTNDSPNHLVVSYQIKDRGHPTVYQVEHLLLAGNTLGIVHMETQAVPTEELLGILAGGADTVAGRLAALGV